MFQSFFVIKEDDIDSMMHEKLFEKLNGKGMKKLKSSSKCGEEISRDDEFLS